MQRPAKPYIPVRFRSQPPSLGSATFDETHETRKL
jgi:hypothetical protein